MLLPSSTTPMPPPVETTRPRPVGWLLLAALLAGIGFFIYHPVSRFEFINFDDPLYLSGNPWLKSGLSWESVHWAFTANLTGLSNHAEYWCPITLLSRLLDAQLFGVQPGPFHVTSAVLHVLNAALLALALWRLSGAWRRSAVVALLFLAHPLNAEPVCWLSARKDLLSATFLFLTLLAYAHYVRRQNARSYLLLLAAYAASLLAKPMGVSTPFLLLVLDFWPLRRWSEAAGSRAETMRLIGEKIPLLILAAISAFFAVLGQRAIKAVASLDHLPLGLRIENAVVSYATYLRRIVWPNDLAIVHPLPSAFPLSEVLAAATCLAALAAAAAWLYRRAPYGLAGGLWFGLVLGPVIGLVQIGSQASADRYAYPSIIGIFIAVVWGVADVLRARPRLAGSFAAAAVTGFALLAARQALFFRDSAAVFARAIAVAPNDQIARQNLGCALFEKEDLEGARREWLETIRINPATVASGDAWVGLAMIEERSGLLEGAVQDYEKALQIETKNARALLALGRVLSVLGRTNQAEVVYAYLRKTDPEAPFAYLALDQIYAASDRWKEVADLWSTYLETHPGDLAGKQHLAEAMAKQEVAH